MCRRLRPGSASFSEKSFLSSAAAIEALAATCASSASFTNFIVFGELGGGKSCAVTELKFREWQRE